MQNKPKVLFVSVNFFSPEFLDGCNKIIYNLLLEKELYQSTFISMHSGKLASSEEVEKFSHLTIKKFDRYVKTPHKLNKDLQWIIGQPTVSLPKKEAYHFSKKVAQLAQDQDIIYLSSLSLASCLPYLPSNMHRKVILAAIDSYSMYTERRITQQKNPIKKALLKRELRISKKFESMAYKLAARTTFVSPEDLNFTQKRFPIGRYIHIPLGVNTDYFHPAPKTTVAKLNQIIFTGNLGYAPNKDVCYFLVNEVLPLLEKKVPDIKLVLAGANPPEELLARKNPRVIITGRVDDLRPLIWESALFVCPLRFGAGMKNKILEIFAMEKPFICSELSLHGIEVGVKLDEFIVKDLSPELWSELISETLLKKVDNKELVSPSLRKYMESYYSWHSARKNLDLLIGQLNAEECTEHNK